NVDQSVVQLAGTNVYSTLYDVGTDPSTGEPTLSPRSPEPRFDSIVAVYNVDGELVGVAGGDEGKARIPVFPTQLSVQDAFLSQEHPFTLDALVGTDYRAAVAPIQVDGNDSSSLYAQLVALPLNESERFVQTYVGVFTAMTILTLIPGALGTRLLVTLPFRRLGQVEQPAMRLADGDCAQRRGDA